MNSASSQSHAHLESARILAIALSAIISQATAACCRVKAAGGNVSDDHHSREALEKWLSFKSSLHHCERAHGKCSEPSHFRRHCEEADWAQVGKRFEIRQMLDDVNAGAEKERVGGAALVGCVIDVVGVDADESYAASRQSLSRAHADKRMLIGEVGLRAP